jgi:AAA+ ATPase superfamily predicted ATPase
MEYFPLGLAEGKAFCNRVEERAKLKTNIGLNRSTVVMSPRRYGKSSLVLYVLNDLDIPYIRVDMFVTLDETTVAKEIVDGVNNLINKIISKPEQLIASMKDILKNVNTKWSVGTDGVKIELSRKSSQDDALTIRDVLLILDNVLENTRKKAVFFIDEFQEIGVVASAKGIEGAIRSVAEKSKNLVFIFSGSNRHTLKNMFEDRSRPLYMLCDKIALGRILDNDYIKFINTIAQKKWGEPLSSSFFDELFTVTELHPYYVNLICGRLYITHETLPTRKNVEKVWYNYLLEEKSNTAIELSKLSSVQKKVLIIIAQGQQTNLTAKETISNMSTTSASVIKALNSLVQKDYIYEVGHSTYQIVDPLIRSSICAFFPIAHDIS